MLQGQYLLLDLETGRVVYQTSYPWEQLKEKIIHEKILSTYNLEDLRLIDVCLVPYEEDKYVKAFRIGIDIERERSERK